MTPNHERLRLVTTNDESLIVGPLDHSKTNSHNPAIITTEPNELTRQVHDRMPVILPPDHYERWLDPELNDKEELQAMLKSYPAEAMESYEVSPYVSNARNEGPQCIEPARPS